jgi:hypothetical protein
MLGQRESAVQLVSSWKNSDGDMAVRTWSERTRPCVPTEHLSVLLKMGDDDKGMNIAVASMSVKSGSMAEGTRRYDGQWRRRAYK